ncbi:hypothetical protein [Streptomyces sp. NPDC051310]|uniref:hypothetical protein n=1 Tax=Streptomyces sp. NPDC051310 TaxID=3365649 RepID=UPI0037BB5FAB
MSNIASIPVLLGDQATELLADEAGLRMRRPTRRFASPSPPSHMCTRPGGWWPWN